MGDRERTGGSGTRWYAVYSRATVHQVAEANVSTNEYVPGVIDNNAGDSTDASRKPAYQNTIPYTNH